jgi:uncharacterized membrane protein
LSFRISFPLGSHARSLAKAMSYRLLGSACTALIFYLPTIVKPAVYFVHDRLWNQVRYGRLKPPEYET